LALDRSKIYAQDLTSLKHAVGRSRRDWNEAITRIQAVIAAVSKVHADTLIARQASHALELQAINENFTTVIAVSTKQNFSFDTVQ
jgi:hypothetical protein